MQWLGLAESIHIFYDKRQGREDDDDDDDDAVVVVATNHGDQEDTARCPTQPIRTRVS